jgi:hypothetical protein
MQSIQELKIPTNKIFYDTKTDVLSVYLLDIVFIGNYKKSTKLSRILDDIFDSLNINSLLREDISIVDFITNSPISENTPLKKLSLISKQQVEKLKEKKIKEAIEPQEVEKDTSKSKKKAKAFASPKRKAEEPVYADELLKQEEEEFMEESYKLDDDIKSEELMEEKERSRARPSPIPPPASRPAIPPAPGAPVPTPKAAKEELAGFPPDSILTKPEADIEEEPNPTTYEINMGLQYYSVMMEQTSYLFYVYFSHKELKIVDEEGKTIFETSFRISTTKKEPPILKLRVEGDSFEVHPLFGEIIVKKDAINPPVMIFSVLPVKKKGKRTKKERRDGERRHLHVYVEFEEKVINHSILSVIVQPKHFHLDIGPLHLDVSKRTAMIISFISILIAVGSLIYTIFSWDISSTAVDVVSKFAPGLGSLLFFGIFLYTLFKEGLYPLKEKISYFLNFDKTGMLIK